MGYLQLYAITSSIQHVKHMKISLDTTEKRLSF